MNCPYSSGGTFLYTRVYKNIPRAESSSDGGPVPTLPCVHRLANLISGSKIPKSTRVKKNH